MKRIILTLLLLQIIPNTYAKEKLPTGTKEYFNYLSLLTGEISTTSRLLAAMLSNDDEIDITNPETQKIGCEVIRTTDRLIEIDKNKPIEFDNTKIEEARTIKAMMNMSMVIMVELDKQGIHCPK